MQTGFKGVFIPLRGPQAHPDSQDWPPHITRAYLRNDVLSQDRLIILDQ